MATPRSPQELAQQAEKTRERLALVAGAALVLLRKKRNATVLAGLDSGLPIPLIAHKLRRSLALSVAEARTYSRDAGIKRLSSEIVSADLKAVIQVNTERAATHAQAARDLIRGRAAADGYAKRWETKAVGDTAEEAAAAASADTAGSLKRIAVTESAESFNESRLDEAREAAADTGIDLYRRWDAQSDSCPECSDLDGSVVGLDESFSDGEPGSIHPSCCCSWELLTAAEAGESRDKAA